MKEMYVTVTGFCNYRGIFPFKIGNLIRCEKEADNLYDSEAIKCTVPILGTVGYVANSVNTMANGTMSAGRLYDKVPKKFYIRVMFTTCTKVICKVEDGEPNELKIELLSKLGDDWDNAGDVDEDDDDSLGFYDCGGEYEEDLVDDEDM